MPYSRTKRERVLVPNIRSVIQATAMLLMGAIALAGCEGVDIGPPPSFHHGGSGSGSQGGR